jgi:hypothetical protein
MFSTHGFYWAGFLRTLQGDVTGMAVSLIVLIAVLLGARAFVRQRSGGPDSRQAALARTNRSVAVLALLFVGGFVLHAALMTSSNRIPRSDVNKSGVYDQMDSHLTNPDHPH